MPPDCETLEIPTLSAGAAYDAFYNIYKDGGRSDPVNGILKRLNFHPLSMTPLATVAHQNDGNNTQLVREWEKRQIGVLQTKHHTGLTTTIELRAASPKMFQGPNPDALGLLGVVVFYPGGGGGKP